MDSQAVNEQQQAETVHSILEGVSQTQSMTSMTSLPPIESSGLTQTLVTEENVKIDAETGADPKQQVETTASQTAEASQLSEESTNGTPNASRPKNKFVFEQWRIENGFYSTFATPKHIEFIQNKNAKNDPDYPPPPQLGETGSQYFKRVRHLLNRKNMSGVIGKPEVFWKHFRNEVLRRLDFRGLPLDQAVRLLGATVMFPLETSHKGILIEDFAQRYHDQNSDLFDSPHVVYLVVYAMIMLNTHIHHPSFKKKAFKQQVKKSALHDLLSRSDIFKTLAPELLDSLYESITKKNLLGDRETEEALFDDVATDIFTPELQYETEVKTFFDSERRMSLSQKSMPTNLLSKAQQLGQIYANYAGLEFDQTTMFRRAPLDHFYKGSDQQDEASFYAKKRAMTEKNLSKYFKFLDEIGFVRDASFIGKRGGQSVLSVQNAFTPKMRSTPIPAAGDAATDLEQELYAESGQNHSETSITVGRGVGWSRYHDPAHFRASPSEGPRSDFKPSFEIRSSDCCEIFGEVSSLFSNPTALFSLFLASMDRLPLTQHHNTPDASFLGKVFVTPGDNNLVKLLEQGRLISALQQFHHRTSKHRNLQVIYHGPLIRKSMYDQDFKKSGDRKWRGGWVVLVATQHTGFEIWFYSDDGCSKVRSWLEYVYEEFGRCFGADQTHIDQALWNEKLGDISNMPNPSKRINLNSTVAYLDSTYTQYPDCFQFAATPATSLSESEDIDSRTFNLMMMTTDHDGLLRPAPLPHHPMQALDSTDLSFKTFARSFMQGIHFHQTAEQTMKRSELKSKDTFMMTEKNQWMFLMNSTAAVSTAWTDMTRMVNKARGRWDRLQSEVHHLFFDEHRVKCEQASIRIEEYHAKLETHGPDYQVSEEEKHQNELDEALLALDLEDISNAKSWKEIESKLIQCGFSRISVDIARTMSELDILANRAVRPADADVKDAVGLVLVLLKIVYYQYVDRQDKTRRNIIALTHKLNQLEITILSQAHLRRETAKGSSAGLDDSQRRRAMSAATIRMRMNTVILDPGSGERRGRMATLNTQKMGKARRPSVMSMNFNLKQPGLEPIKEDEEVQDFSKLASDPEDQKPAKKHAKLSTMLENISNMFNPGEYRMRQEITDIEKQLDLARISHEKWRVYSSVVCRIIMILSIEWDCL